MKSVAASAALFVTAIVGPSAYAQKELSIAQIQGPGNVSPHVEETVRVSGIVTARTKSGFYIQMPDDKIDADLGTSEGIFIFTKTPPEPEAAVGSDVTVTGKVQEYRPRNEQQTLPVTELSVSPSGSYKAISKANALPKPIILSLDDFKKNSLDQLERYEGMRVAVGQMSVVAATDGRVDSKSASSKSDGVFYGVVKGLPRPFRSAGYDLFSVAFMPDKEKAAFVAAHPKLPMFDGNPERLRIESLGQEGSKAVEVAAGTQLTGVTGVMHYAYHTYTILLDPLSSPTAATNLKTVPLPKPSDRQFVIAGMNLENFFDDRDDADTKDEIVSSEGFAIRLQKISTAIRTLLQSPDVIAAVEVENLSALKRLADKINADSVASGQTSPRYEAFLEKGNDGRGISTGYLVKTTRVRAVEVKQLAGDVQYSHPVTGAKQFLFDRPPLMLRAAVDDPKTGKPFEVTLIANHLKSFLGFDDDRSENVRMKKRLEAEWLADFIQARQKADSSERLVMLGDFNAFQFGDGVMDQIGTIKGRPSTTDEVLEPSKDVIERDLVDLVDQIDRDQRYSFVFEGNAQVLDHIIVNEPLKPFVNGFGFVRVNADFPESLRGSADRMERFSDHDPAIVYFTLDAPAAKTTK